jgi:hypothetical protein
VRLDHLLSKEHTHPLIAVVVGGWGGQVEGPLVSLSGRSRNCEHYWLMSHRGLCGRQRVLPSACVVGVWKCGGCVGGVGLLAGVLLGPEATGCCCFLGVVFENCRVDASIFVVKLCRAHGGCLGIRGR